MSERGPVICGDPIRADTRPYPYNVRSGQGPDDPAQGRRPGCANIEHRPQLGVGLQLAG